MGQILVPETGGGLVFGIGASLVMAVVKRFNSLHSTVRPIRDAARTPNC